MTLFATIIDTILYLLMAVNSLYLLVFSLASLFPLRQFADRLEAAEDFVVWLLSSLPTLMVLAVLIAVVVIVCRRISKRSREKRRAKWMAMQNAQDPNRDPKQE